MEITEQKEAKIAEQEDTRNRKRKRQARLREGETRSEILIYIAQKGLASSTDIREHLRVHLNIKNKKSSIYHLDQLELNKQLTKMSQRKGYADIYTLVPSLNSLRDTFNYLKDQHKEMDFIKTEFFKSYVSTDDFKAKLFIYFIREALIEFIDYIKSDDGYNALTKIAKGKKLPKSYLENLDLIRNADTSIAKYTKLSELNRVFTHYKAKKMDKQKLYNNISAIIKKSDTDIIFSHLFAINSDISLIINTKLLNILVSDKEIQEILAMIRSSPTAIDHILNFNKLDPLLEQLDMSKIMDLATGFLIRALTDDIIKAEKVMGLVSVDKAQKNIISKLQSTLSDYSNIENRSPIHTLVKMTFIYDLLCKNVDIQPKDKLLLSEVINDTFLPKIKT